MISYDRCYGPKQNNALHKQLNLKIINYLQILPNSPFWFSYFDFFFFTTAFHKKSNTNVRNVSSLCHLRIWRGVIFLFSPIYIFFFFTVAYLTPLFADIVGQRSVLALVKWKALWID